MPHPFLQALLGHDAVVVTTHVRPDGDAIGSLLALGLYLEELGKDVTMICDDPVPEHLDWMPGADRIRLYDGSLIQRATIAQADAVVLVDCNASTRVGEQLEGPIRHSGATKFLVDHHTSPEQWFDHAYWRAGAAATVELLYELMVTHRPTSIRGAIAMALYVGLVTDTGSFRFETVTPGVHRMAAALLEDETINPGDVHGSVYEMRSMAWVRLLRRALGSLTICQDGRVGYVAIARGVFGDYGATREDAEGLVDYPLALEGVQVALHFTETAKGTKVSFRSKGSQYVDGWARSLGGGGHRNAAGVFLPYPLHEARRLVLAGADRYLNEPPGGTKPSLDEEDRAYLANLVQDAH